MNDDDRTARFRTLAQDLDRIDREVYAAYGRDPLEPIIGAGDRAARVCLFGRDPGRHEVEHATPFIGKGGQLVRDVLGRHLCGREPADLEEYERVGRYVFWANTVPYKPKRNKPYGKRIKRRFRPIMADLLVEGCQGRDVITLGRVAFLWFGLHDRAVEKRLEKNWKQPDAFERTFEASIPSPAGEGTFRLHPLPHPSPLNARWHKKFPGLLEQRLQALGLSTDDWRVDDDTEAT